MFCPKCGTENPETGRFCRACGTDLGNVSSALSGELSGPQPVLLDKKGRPVNWESAIAKLFGGLAFLAVSIALAFSQMGRYWWFWLLIPAFGGIGTGLAQLVQLKKTEQQNTTFVPDKPNRISTPVREALPSSDQDYIKPQSSIYQTGELIEKPASVTEGTTRHLSIDKEGETITLPEIK